MAALPHSCYDHQRMLMRRMQGRRSRLQLGPTSRTRDSVWFLFPCRDFDPIRNLSKLIPPSTSYFWASPLPPASARNALVGPEEMFEPNIVQTRFCFFASAASGRSELIIDSSRRFPLRIFLQQSTSVKSSFVIPKKLAPLVRPPFVFQNFVKRCKRAGSITFLFQAQSLFEDRLVAPVDRLLFMGG